MKIEDDLRRALHDRARLVDVDPVEAWTRFDGAGPEPRVGRRLIAGAVAFAVFFGAAGLVWRMLRESPTVSTPAQAQQYESAKQLMAALRTAGVGCERLEALVGLFPTNRDSGGCDVTGGNIAVYVYPSVEAMANDRAMRPPRRWVGVSWVVGPNWFVATGSSTAAETVRGVVGGVVLGGPEAQASATDARYFFSSSGVSGVFEVSNLPPSICYSTSTLEILPIAVVSTTTRVSVASFAPQITNDFCDRDVSLYLVSDLIANPTAYQISWVPVAGGPTQLSSFTWADPLSKYVDPSGWTLNYPSTWSVADAGSFPRGITLTNYSETPAGAISLTILPVPTGEVGGQDLATLPLTLDQFTQVGADQVLRFRGGGVTYVATLHIGDEATDADVASLVNVLFSLHFPEEKSTSSAS